MNEILLAIGIVIPSIIVALVYLINGFKEPGTKGITKPYTTKDGVKRTAKKDREDYIV